MTALSERPRVIFVDDDPDVLAGIRRALHRERSTWDLRLARSGVEAMEMVGMEEPDIVVTDMRMPGMDGQELLRALARHHPAIVRIVLSGAATPEQVARAAPLVHRWLPKPCDRAALMETLRSALDRRAGRRGEAIDELVGGVQALPTSPRLYGRLVAAQGDGGWTFEEVARLVETDPAVNAKLLQWGRSPLLGAYRAVSAREVIAAVGLDTVCQLVLSIEVLERMSPETELPGFDSESFRLHAELTARLAAAVVAPADVAVTQVAGLLQGVGLLILTTRARRQLEAALARASELGTTYEHVEEEVIGVHHAQVGARLLSLWGLPPRICDAVGGAPTASLDLDVAYLAPAPAVRVAAALAMDLVSARRGVDHAWAQSLVYDTVLDAALWWPRFVEVIDDELRRPAGAIEGE